MADYAVKSGFYKEYICTLFDENIGYPETEDTLERTSCGAGKMVALGPSGKIYPCLRYKDYSLNNKEEWVLGDVENGINMEKVRPFMVVNTKLQSDVECRNCEVAVGCSFCQGFNYDEAMTDTNFSRAKYICKMHKARVRANRYYFNRLFNEFSITKNNSHGMKESGKKMKILLSDDYVSHCQFNNTSELNCVMNSEQIRVALKYAHDNFFDPIIVHSKSEFSFKNEKEYSKYKIDHIIPIKYYDNAQEENLKDCFFVFEKEDIQKYSNLNLKSCIFNIQETDVYELSKYISDLLDISDRIEVNIQSLSHMFDEQTYKEQLIDIKDLLINKYLSQGIVKEINLITDLLFLKSHSNCKAGHLCITYVGNGDLYLCPAIYSLKRIQIIGEITSGLFENKDLHLFNGYYDPICSRCDAFQCNNCRFVNKNYTNEVNVSPSFQCRKSFIEREVTRLFQLETGINIENEILEAEFKDPIDNLLKKNNYFMGYYKY